MLSRQHSAASKECFYLYIATYGTDGEFNRLLGEYPDAIGASDVDASWLFFDTSVASLCNTGFGICRRRFFAAVLLLQIDDFLSS